ncbi:hypothetical protein RJD39_08675 [Vibrio scophthalmi]|uniref:hypothetical protein n=1 Tax=Vibrio scophthalmi TaxID=45658 RepID=UPI003873A054
MNNNETEELFLQVRTAQRLLAAYYQRLLPAIEKLAKEFDTDFWFWKPCRFSNSARNPFSNWQWDMLPAAIPRYEFKNVAHLDKVTKGDFILEFIVMHDTGIRDEQRHSEPDALNMAVKVEDAKSLLKLCIYRAHCDQSKSFEAAWNMAEYPKPSPDYHCKLDHDFVTTAFEEPIASFLTEEGIERLKQKIKDSLERTLEFVPALDKEQTGM